MAARRLLIVLLILLGVSTLAATLIPSRSLREGTTSETTPKTDSTTTLGEEPPGRSLQATLRVAPGKVKVVAGPVCRERKPRCEPIKVGDTLALSVYSLGAPAELEIPAFGLIGVATPTSPALFELLFRSAASYGVRFTGSRKIAARIEVLPATGKGSAKPKSG